MRAAARPPCRAAATACAVWRAVPDGASTLSGWCSSTISTDSKYGAASAANRMSRTAPIAEVGRDDHADPGRRSSQPRTRRRAAPRRTRWCRRRRGRRRRPAARALPMTASGRVKSTATWAAGVGERRRASRPRRRRRRAEPVGRLDRAADLACPCARGHRRRRPGCPSRAQSLRCERVAQATAAEKSRSSSNGPMTASVGRRRAGPRRRRAPRRGSRRRTGASDSSTLSTSP